MVEQVAARILVVDSDTASRSTLDVVLFCQGYAVCTAANGEEALGWLMQQPFDLLVIDLALPGLSGLELARCARRCQPSTQVLFLASNCDFDEILREEHLDRFEWLPKTAPPEAIAARVAQRLEPDDRMSLRSIERAREFSDRLPVAA
jgi:DNA-binding response OmpR family regulator